MAKNYKVEILEKKGSCDTKLFEKMVENGDINSTKVSEMINEVIEITGYAVCHIITEDKEFDMNYFATTKGIVSTGSNVFKESVLDYISDCSKFVIKSLKTKKGTTYKVSPILTEEVSE